MNKKLTLLFLGGLLSLGLAACGDTPEPAEFVYTVEDTISCTYDGLALELTDLAIEYSEGFYGIDEDGSEIFREPKERFLYAIASYRVTNGGEEPLPADGVNFLDDVRLFSMTGKAFFEISEQPSELLNRAGGLDEEKEDIPAGGQAAYHYVFQVPEDQLIYGRWQVAFEVGGDLAIDGVPVEKLTIQQAEE